ncbi:late embryogenesis abundant protein 7 isoform X2 [Mercurialis annua]|uniref:late embryogenesis abundant protein 7 isoform X2 n=1 Tax=Mercurialis annua TaxID=3986 RepID=UPI00215E8AA7|nr:late embryogenesis abundant protein 7 isoform X2 [Mercurialis annua]
MASRGQNFSSEGQQQLRKEEHATIQPSNPSLQSHDHDHHHDHDQSSYTTQATQFLQQTGEQVKNMAQGAAVAVKNTLGMNDNTSDPSNTSGGNNPINLSHSAGHQSTTTNTGSHQHRI